MKTNKSSTLPDARSAEFAKTARLQLRIVQATVDWVRSEDHNVYLTGLNVTGATASTTISGWAEITDAHTFAILAAAGAAGRQVAFEAKNHDPAHGGGAGLFKDVNSVRFEGTPF